MKACLSPIFSYAKKLFYFVFFHLASYNAQSAGNFGPSRSDIRFSGNIVKMYPASVFTFNNPLCSQDKTIFMFVFKSGKRVLNFFLGEFFSGFYSYATENFICMVMMVIVSAAAVIIMVIMMMFMTAMLFMVIMMMSMTAAALTVVMIMMVMVFILVMVMVMLLFKMTKSPLYCVFSLNSRKNLIACNLIPVRSNYNGIRIMILYHFNSFTQLIFAYL